MQRGGKDPLKVWSIRNKKTKIHLREKPARNAHTSLSVHISEHDGIQGPLPDPPLWMHATVCFSRRQHGFSGHCRLAKQDLFAQTLRIRIIGAAFPLVQSSTSHSAGQHCRNGLITPAGQPLNVQTCPPATPPRAAPRLQPLGLPLRLSPLTLSFSPFLHQGPALVSQNQENSWRAGPVLCISTFPLTQGIP